MKKAIFSIVAKNYLPMANALGDSSKRVHPDIPFFVIVADPEDGMIVFEEQQYPIVPATALGIDRLEEMAFKYNVTEFCTALKPFSFDYFFRQGFEKVIYFDPDIYVFSSLDAIFEQLRLSSIVVTPHVCTLQKEYTGLVPEGMLMHTGIFNFGFCAISNSTNGRRIVEWWETRLIDQCYADKIDGLHTDQKWMDFMPSMIEDLYIERGLGYNVAIWNCHERQIKIRDNQFYVFNRINGSGLMPLVFFHYSNFIFDKATDISLFRPKYIQKFPDVDPVGDYYAERLANQNISDHIKLHTYYYDRFNNGIPINYFHRRLFRQLINSGYTFNNPFFTENSDSFYTLLKKNGLVNTSAGQISRKQNEMNFAGFDRKLMYVQMIAKIIMRIIGIDRYALLCKFAQRFVRPENQTFLINEVGNKIPFYNENRYINWQVTEKNVNRSILEKAQS